MDPDKKEFAKISLDKSAQFKDDPMIQFVILWIGLNALYSQMDGGERKKLQALLQKNCALVQDCLNDFIKQLQAIDSYVGIETQHRNLKKDLSTKRSFVINAQHPNAVSDFGAFIYQVRNNMFHAGKLWSQQEENKLLAMLNPIIESLLTKLVNK
jgi:hypothetical protein